MANDYIFTFRENGLKEALETKYSHRLFFKVYIQQFGLAFILMSGAYIIINDGKMDGGETWWLLLMTILIPIFFYYLLYPFYFLYNCWKNNSCLLRLTEDHLYQGAYDLIIPWEDIHSAWSYRITTDYSEVIVLVHNFSRYKKQVEGLRLIHLIKRDEYYRTKDWSMIMNPYEFEDPKKTTPTYMKRNNKITFDAVRSGLESKEDIWVLTIPKYIRLHHPCVDIVEIIQTMKGHKEILSLED